MVAFHFVKILFLLSFVSYGCSENINNYNSTVQKIVEYSGTSCCSKKCSFDDSLCFDKYKNNHKLNTNFTC